MAAQAWKQQVGLFVGHERHCPLATIFMVEHISVDHHNIIINVKQVPLKLWLDSWSVERREHVLVQRVRSKRLFGLFEGPKQKELTKGNFVDSHSKIPVTTKSLGIPININYDEQQRSAKGDLTSGSHHGTVLTFKDSYFVGGLRTVMVVKGDKDNVKEYQFLVEGKVKAKIGVQIRKQVSEKKNHAAVKIPDAIVGMLSPIEFVPKSIVPGILKLDPKLDINVGMSYDRQTFEEMNFGMDFNIPISFGVSYIPGQIPRPIFASDPTRPSIDDSAYFNFEPLRMTETKQTSITAKFAPQVRVDAKCPFLGTEQDLLVEDTRDFTIALSQTRPLTKPEEDQCPWGRRELSVYTSKTTNFYLDRKKTNTFMIGSVARRQFHPKKMVLPRRGATLPCVSSALRV